MKHEAYELRQMQAVPLEMKIRMTKERIEAWYENWTRFEIRNTKTGKRRFKTIDTRDKYNEPETKEDEVIDAAYDGQIYVSFSGGKDSTVLKHMVDSMYDDVPSVFVNTGLEYPEIQNFARKQENVIVVRPKKNFRDVLLEYGYPVISKEIAKNIKDGRSARERGVDSAPALRKLRGEMKNKAGDGPSSWNCQNWAFMLDAPFKISPYCCNVMKKGPAHAYETETGRKPMTAVMADESMLRLSRWLKMGCNAFEANRPNSAPMSFWTEQDVLHYLEKYKVPYSSVYGEIREKGVLPGQVELDGFEGADGKELELTGCDRTGCIFCMFGCHLDSEPTRFQRLKETHPRQYEYCIGGGEFVDGMWQPSKDGLGLGFVLDYIGVKY